MSPFKVEDDEIRIVARHVSLDSPMTGGEIAEMLAHVQKEIGSGDAADASFTTDASGLHARYTVQLGGPTPAPTEPTPKPPATPRKRAAVKKAAPLNPDVASKARAPRPEPQKSAPPPARKRVPAPFVTALTETGGKRSRRLPTMTADLVEQMLMDLPSGTYYFRLHLTNESCPTPELMEAMVNLAAEKHPEVLVETASLPHADAFSVTTLHE